jgi:CheY-like chemotaxis protein
VSPVSRQIWIVDDEPDVLAYLVLALEDAGYVAHGFASAREFLDQARGSLPDLLCLDIMMPDESGLSLYKVIRGRHEWDAVPIVMVSGYSRAEEFQNGEFRSLIGDAAIPPPEGFVEKPVELARFLHLVERLLSSPSDATQARDAQGPS